MRIGGLLALAPALLGSCSLPSEPVKACKDGVMVNFGRGIDQLGLDALNHVLLAVSTLKACPAAKATVTGHIDRAELGSPLLAQGRAANVRSLMTKRGIDPNRITVRDVSAPSKRLVTIEWR